MTDTTNASPWTDEDVEAATHRTRYVEQRRALVADVDLPREYARVAAAALAPRVAELQRAAKVEALREAVGDPRLVASVAAVIADPNATTPRLPNEQVTEWTARAVLAAMGVMA